MSENYTLTSLQMNSEWCEKSSASLIEDDVENFALFEDHEDRMMIRLMLRMRDTSISCEKGGWILEECKSLFARDYFCKYVDNFDNIPGVHPMMLVIPVAEKYTLIKNFDAEEKTKCEDVEFMRLEAECNKICPRILCPVFLYKGKYICRSRYPSILKVHPKRASGESSQSAGSMEAKTPILRIAKARKEMKRMNFAVSDANFLRRIKVTTIHDLSNPKECSFMEDMQSEELKCIYKNIEISNMPYPGREIFENLLEDSRKSIEEYTKECLKVFLCHMIKGEGGLLIQSFTGRNRTSLFVSLLRLSLWADGIIHRNLEMREIALLTLGYDWYLFGYRVNGMQDADKEMLHFFFTFLPMIASQEFSIKKILEDDSSLMEMPIMSLSVNPSREKSLKELSALFLKNYKKSTQCFETFKQRNSLH